MFYISWIIAICAVILMLYYRHQSIKTFNKLNSMIDSIMEGAFCEKTLDESRLSALESKFAHYLRASLVSSQNVEEERGKIKSFITDISHQTRIPISNILLYSEMLMENTWSEEDCQNLEALHGQAEKLNFLISSLVKLSRLETGIVAVNATWQNVELLAQEIYTQYKSPAEQKGLYLHLMQSDENSEDSYMAKYDKKWTTEAVGNIIDNAIKYTDKGGITISLKSYELFCCIEISDTGIGISEEETALIFKRFYRSHSVSQIQGIGVGLYLAREIVSSEGGYIKVISKPGKGAKFCVYLRKSN